MRHLILSSSPLFLGVMLLVLGNGLIGTLLGVRLVQAGYPAYIPGLMAAAYFVGLVTASVTAHRIIALAGHIRAFASFASICSAAMLSHGFAVDPALWAVLRLIEGFCIAVLYMCIESWLHDRATNKTRGKFLSIYMITIYFALGASQFLLNLWEPSAFALFGICSVLMSIALVPVALARTPAPPLPSTDYFGLRRLYRISPLGTVGCFASGAVVGAFYGLGPVFADGVALDIAGTARFMAATILGGLVLQWPLGWLSDRFDRRTVIAVSCAAMGLTAGTVIAVMGAGEAALLTVAAINGGFVFALYPLCVSHANDFIDGRDRVGASGGLMLAYGAGAVVGPLAASGAIMGMGPAGLFALGGAVGVFTLLFSLWRMSRRAAPPIDEQEDFRPLPRTTPHAMELDPRADESPASDVIPSGRSEDDDIF